MSRYGTTIIAVASMVTALAAVVVALRSTSREAHAGGQLSAMPVVASTGGGPQPAPAAIAGAAEGNAPSQPEGASSLPRSEPASSYASGAGGAPAPAALAPSNDQVAALRGLVAQSQQGNEQLGQIDYQLQALRQQAADEQSRRQAAHEQALRQTADAEARQQAADAEAQQQAADEEAQQQAEAQQETAQHAATLEALGTLRQAESLLATGNSDGVNEELGRAEQALSGRTLIDVEAAREALRREDLYPARQYLAAALAERRIQR